jgi:hypothetical protein
VLTGTNVSRLYGDPNPTITGTIVGLKNGNTGTATFSTTALITSPVGSYPINGVFTPAGGTSASNYTITSSGNVTVTPAPLNVTASNVTRAYGDPNPSFAGAITGLKNGDAITGVFGVTADATSPVGTYPITATLTDPGNKLSNYTVVNTGTLPLTVVANSATRLYGDVNPAFTGSVTGQKNGDAITATFSTTATPASNVGTYPIVATLVDPGNKAGNYTFTPASGTLTVTQAPLAVTAADATRIYGDANPAFTGTIVGLKNADPITATYATTAVLASNVGTFTIVPAAVDAPTPKLSNYTVTLTNGLLTVNPAPLSITGNNATRLYGDANPAFTATPIGLKNGDAITATASSPATPASVVGSFAIVPAAIDAPTPKLGNYTVTLTNGTLAITQAPLTIAANAASRLYGDPNPAFTGTVTGIKNADNITATFSTTAGLTTGVGAASIVPAAVDPTAKLGNYSLVLTNGTLTINPAPLTVSAGSVSRLYGDPNPAFVGSVIGLKNGDNITAIVGGVGADPTSPVGTFVLVPQLVDPTNKAANYTVTLNNGTLTITAAPLLITANNATRLYGDPNPAFSPTFTGIRNADAISASFTTAATAASNVGTFSIIPTPVDAPTPKLSNYIVTVANGTLTVTPAPLAINAANATRIYGDANPAFTATPVGLKNGDAITATASSTATPASPAGSAVITPVAVDAVPSKLGNYTVALNNGTLTINKAPLTIAATPASRVYGDPNPAFTGTVAGIKNADPITATFSTTAGLTTPVGVATIVPTAVDPAAKLGNYTLALINANLTISPAPLTVTAGNVTRLYGDPNPPFNGTILGLKNGDNITAIVSGAGAAPGSPVGSYVLVPSLVDSVPSTLGNYTPAFTNGTLTITAAPLTITGNNATRAYGDPNPAFTATFAGLKNADNITASFSSAAQTAGVGSYPIVLTPVDPGAKLTNYSVSVTNGTLTVSPAALSLVATNATRLYGDPNPLFTGTLTGVKNADAITASFTSVAVATSPVGPVVILANLTASAATLANYTVASQNGTLTIAPAPLTVTGSNDSRLYGDPNPVFSGTISGVKNLDNIAASFGSTATVTSPVGTYPIAGTLVDPTNKLPNYTVINNNGTLTVTPAPLTVTATNASRLYGDPNPAFTGTVTGLRNADAITASFTSVGPASAVGVFPITPVLADPTNKLGNYAVTSNNGVLTIGPASLSVSAANASRPYGAANPVFTGSITGIKNADNITATFNTTANTASGVGTYVIVPVLVDPTAKLGNYAVTSSNAVLTVTQAKPAVVLNVAAAVPTSQLTAQVQNTGPALPTGTVQFFDGAASLGAPVAIAVQGGVATASLQIGLANGAHSITANYSGDATYIASTSTPVPVNVGSTPTFGLSGTGGNTTATVAAGKDAVYNLSLANQGFAGNISFACSGAPAGTTCSVNPNPLTVSAASSSAPITVTISNTQNARLKPLGSKPFGSKMPMFVFAGVLVGLFSGMSKKRRKLVLVFMAAFMIAGMVACGGGSLNVSNGGGRGPTNATVSVVGTSGTQTATINLSLTITH